MDSEEGDILRSLALAAIVLVSAAVTATAVVAAGSGYFSSATSGASSPLVPAPPSV